MSPNPGEPEHETRGWTHAICDHDYRSKQAIKKWATTPFRWLEDPAVCCYCGGTTNGIYVRASPSEVHGSEVTPSGQKDQAS